MIIRSLLIAAAIAGGAAAAAAQDTLRLAELQETARRRDPRAAQLDLLETQTSLRLRNLAVERLPQLSLSGEATHQTDVTSVELGPGVGPPPPPKDRWQAVLQVQQLVYDGGSIGLRRSVERARLQESRSAVRSVRYRLLSEVNAAFFSAFLFQERAAEMAGLIADLEARLAVLRARVREGAALSGDAAAIEAEMLRAMQGREELLAARRAALESLGELIGRPLDSGAVLELPDRADDVAGARGRGGADSIRARPEFEQFASTRRRIGSEAGALAAEQRPRLVAFGQAGYGKPGLDQFNREPDEFGIAGVRLEWRFWNWGATRRQREVLRLQQRIVDTEEAAFAESLQRGVRADLAEMDRLASALELDDRIVALRETAERQARAQLDEGALTAAEYVNVRTDLLDARLERQRHRVELARARTNYLTLLGMMPQ